MTNEAQGGALRELGGAPAASRIVRRGCDGEHGFGVWRAYEKINRQDCFAILPVYFLIGSPHPEAVLPITSPPATAGRRRGAA